MCCVTLFFVIYAQTHAHSAIIAIRLFLFRQQSAGSDCSICQEEGFALLLLESARQGEQLTIHSLCYSVISRIIRVQTVSIGTREELRMLIEQRIKSAYSM